jgi:hypothetical protein
MSSSSAVIEPKNNGNEVRWNGWGFADTAFVVNSEGVVELSGTRYLFSGKRFPMMRAWAEDAAGLKLDVETPSQVREKEGEGERERKGERKRRRLLRSLF